MKDQLTCLFRGINVSIFVYGQTSTGKTYTMKGKADSLNGIIPLSIKEIFSKLNEDSITKSSIRVSYVEIYNETVNDLIDSSKKNLEIRESLARGIFVNNVTEISVTNFDKVFQLLNIGENNRSFAETKLNEKSSRSHTIFKITVEFMKKEIKYVSQLNLIDLAGSENVSKAKSEGMRLKEGANINKSLLALSSVINKLSQSSKNFVNYRDSKLTRLLQTALSGNSKTTIICTIADDAGHYSETINTLHFGLKAKNVKTTVRVNEVVDEKGRIMNENNQLKSKIKMLEEMITEKKENVDMTNTSYANHILSTEQKKEQNQSTHETISTLEKEIVLLKRLVMNKEELGDDLMNNSINNDLYSTHSGALYHGLMQSGYKGNTHNPNRMSSAMKYTDSAMKINPFNYTLGPYHFENSFQDNQSGSTSAYRRSCMTENRLFNQPGQPGPGNYMPNSLQKTSSKLMMSNYNPNDNDYMISSMGNDFYAKENDELKRNLYEIKKAYYDAMQNKENQIKLLNRNHDITIKECEKLIKEAEDNYLNLKLNYEQAKIDLMQKDEEIVILNTKAINHESTLNYYKSEMLKIKDNRNNISSEIESKYNSTIIDNERLKSENDELRREKTRLSDLYQGKSSEYTKFKEQVDNISKSHDKETQALKAEISKLKNQLKQKGNGALLNSSSMNQIANEKKSKKMISNYEEKITKLENVIDEYKANLQKIEETQIVEYQKLLEESFEKINDLNKDLTASQDKVKYLEKTLKIIDSAKKPVQSQTSFINMSTIKPTDNMYQQHQDISINETEGDLLNEASYGNDHMFLSKKRKFLPKIYQTMLEKNIPAKTPKGKGNCYKESSNEISDFQV